METTSKSTSEGWTVDEWARGAKIATPTYYTLPRELRPEQVKIGRRVVIFESPTDWLRRMAQRGEAVKLRSPPFRKAEAPA